METIKQQIIKRKHKRNIWTIREKKKLLKALIKFGHEDLSNIVTAIPSKSESEIIYFIKKHKTAACNELYKSKNFTAVESFEEIHSWLPFINTYCNTKPYLNYYLSAFVLPFVERYGNKFNAHNSSVDFGKAYRVLFNSLLKLRFLTEINDETMSMIYGSLCQLFCEIRNEENTSIDIIKKSIDRCLRETKNNTEITFTENQNALLLPEINVLGFSMEEIKLICKN